MSVTINPKRLSSGNAKPARYPEVALVVATDGAGNGFRGSDFAIGKRWLLTAAHVVYDKPEFDGLAQSIEVSPDTIPEKTITRSRLIKYIFPPQGDPD